MTEEISLPTSWSPEESEEQPDGTVAEFSTETESDIKYIVSILDPEGKSANEYALRLSTINPNSTHVRHDYPIERYETQGEALSGAEAFIDLLSTGLQTQGISTDEPEIEEIRRTIREFTGSGLFSRAHRFLRRLKP